MMEAKVGGRRASKKNARATSDAASVLTTPRHEQSRLCATESREHATYRLRTVALAMRGVGSAPLLTSETGGLYASQALTGTRHADRSKTSRSFGQIIPKIGGPLSSLKSPFRRFGALIVVLLAFSIALPMPAFGSESGETWLNWVWESAGAGVHAKWYYHFEQAGSETGLNSGAGSCTNGWVATGTWTFGNDYCSGGGYAAYTPALADPGVGSHPWAQANTKAAYLWGWAGYCGTC